jgi:hypothetical protein
MEIIYLLLWEAIEKPSLAEYRGETLASDLQHSELGCFGDREQLNVSPTSPIMHFSRKLAHHYFPVVSAPSAEPHYRWSTLRQPGALPDKCEL